MENMTPGGNTIIHQATFDAILIKGAKGRGEGLEYGDADACQ